MENYDVEQSTGSETSARKARYFVLFITIIIVLSIPILLIETPPLVDLPNHVARIFIINNLDDSAFFAEHFQLLYQPIPNVIFDLVTVPLISVIGPWFAARIFLLATVVLFGVGCHLTGNSSDDNYSYSPIIACSLVLSGPLFYGFVNYVMGVSIFLVSFGLWLRWRHRSSGRRLIFLIFLAFLTYLSHLASIVFLGIAVFMVRVLDIIAYSKNERRIAYFGFDAAIFAIPVLSFLLFVTGSGTLGTIEWSTIANKFIVLLTPFRSYSLITDLSFIGGILLFFLMLKIWGRLTVRKEILLVSGIFLFIFFLAPVQVFTSSGADLRILLPGFVLLILSLRADVRTSKAFLLTLAFVALILFRTASVTWEWHQMSNLMKYEAEVLEVIPEKSLIYPMIGQVAGITKVKSERPLVHILAFATIDKQSIFPTLFAIKGQQPLIFRRPMPYASHGHHDADKWKDVINDYDYVWTYDVPSPVVEELRLRSALVFERGKTRIWRVNKRLNYK